MPQNLPTEPLLQVNNLKMHFPVNEGMFRAPTAYVRAVDDVSFHINHGETLGLVGESGCGKSTTGRCLLRLHDVTSGSILFKGKDVAKSKGRDLRLMRRHMQLIFQDPFASLDPRMTAAEIIAEPLVVQGIGSTADHRVRLAELMEMVELNPATQSRFPHEFSGGQRQRIGIARALAVNPDFIVCDEPVSALDVSIQAQIISLLMRLRRELGLTYLFIAHDLAVVRNISDRVAVMYLGKIVEVTTSDELYANPLHPYTVSLLSAVPIPDPFEDRKRARVVLKGEIPSPVNPPSGCPFHTRCPRAIARCSVDVPELVDKGGGHLAACHLV
jgi:oligopeptide transport system ATP-binding protein